MLQRIYAFKLLEKFELRTYVVHSWIEEKSFSDGYVGQLASCKGHNFLYIVFSRFFHDFTIFRRLYRKSLQCIMCLLVMRCVHPHPHTLTPTHSHTLTPSQVDNQLPTSHPVVAYPTPPPSHHSHPVLKLFAERIPHKSPFATVFKVSSGRPEMAAFRTA